MSAPAVVQGSRHEPADGARTLILAAMADELRPLLACTAVERVVARDGVRVTLGRLGGAPVALAECGEGAARSRRTTATLLDRLEIGRLVVIGIAGGLSPGLQPGQLVVAEEIVDLRESPRQRTRSGWIPRLAGALPATVVSSSGILSSAAEKRAVWLESGIGGVAVVDLETAASVGVAAELGVPYGAIRVVCDPAEEDLPFDLDACRDRHGSVSRLKVLGRALRQPGTMGRLWELRRRVRSGSADLAAALEQALQQDEERE